MKAPKKPEQRVGCPIVGIGGSAGALDAFEKFFRNLPEKSGMAFVVIQHLDPDHPSLLVELLTRYAKTPVTTAQDGDIVEPDHIYVIPPSAFLKIEKGKLRLAKAPGGRGARLTVDLFLRSLAEDQKEKAIAIIMSGAGQDGMLGIAAIKEAGGMVMVQDPADATHDGMPRSAIATHLADRVMTAEKMPAALLKYVAHPYIFQAIKPGMLGDRARGHLDKILTILAAQTGYDFHYYKKGTLLRRIERRMGINHIEDSAAYVEFLKKDKAEAESLGQDLLISVTSFFRDPEVFDYLAKEILPGLIAEQNPEKPLRAWIPACASGEEAYSIAMLLVEQAEVAGKKIQFQIFASDLDERALGVARLGIYPEAIEADVTPARLKRFFNKQGSRYQMSPEIRDRVVFAAHNILRDAPFSKLDLISCRNLMIYIEPEMQQRLVSMFHFALNNGGILCLGTSETVGDKNDLFEPLSKKFRIYRRVLFSRRTDFDFPMNKWEGGRKIEAKSGWSPAPRRINLGELTNRVLLENYGPAAALVNQKNEAIYYSGQVDRYLKLGTGDATQNILAMVREGLRAPLKNILREAAGKVEHPLATKAHVIRDGVAAPVRITVHQVVVGGEWLAIVTFADDIEAKAPAAKPLVVAGPHDNAVVRQLEEELEITRRELNATIKELEISNEELKAVNEEAMSMNEEFQSTNEELETSKEELQSLNEELITVNGQLQEKVEEQRSTNNDLNNLISSLDLAAVFLDRDLRIRRFTTVAIELFNIIPTDVGRPLTDITWRFKDPDIVADAKKVFTKLSTIERNVCSAEGQWYIRRMLPYRTEKGHIDGVVITFSNITAMKLATEQVEKASRLAENVINTVHEPLIVLSRNFRVISANQALYRLFEKPSLDVVGQSLFELGDRRWDIPALRQALNTVTASNKPIRNLEIKSNIAGIGPRVMEVNINQVAGEGEEADMLLLAIDDVTERNIANSKIRASEALRLSILETMPDPMFLIDEEGIIRSVSQSAERKLGYRSAEMLGKNVNIVMQSPDHEKHDGFLARYRRTGEKKVIGALREVECRRKDGTVFPADLSVSEITIEGKSFFTGFVHDLSERRAIEQQLLQAQKMEAVGQLTGGVAHDFNNLLTVIQGNLELLEPLAADELQKKLIVRAKDAVTRGSQLSDRLLAFARRQPLRTSIIDLSALVSGFTDMLRHSLGENIEIDVKMAKGLWPVRVDAGQMENAILNLAINARDAMPKGGRLTIRGKNTVLDEAYVKKHLEVSTGEYVELSIADTGSGISREALDHVFEPFFTTKAGGAGTGLGLSMVYGFVKQSNGHIQIESEVGEGATITLFLPRSEQPAKALRRPRAKAGEVPRSRGETILIVEDDVDVRKTAVKQLRALGYQTLEAENGKVARGLVLKGPRPDLIFTDIMMPGGTSGADLARDVLKHDPTLKVVFVSGYAAPTTLGEADDEGSIPILRKPYTEAALARKIREVLDG